jgi:hypothetical protein
MVDPLERLDEFMLPVVDRVRLPVASLVIETRPKMMDRIRRIVQWQRHWFSFDEEIIVSSRDPGIPGMRWVDCGQPDRDDFQAWCSEIYHVAMVDMFTAPFVMVWQWDGFMLNPKSWTHEFLRWDYVGAPLISQYWWERARLLEKEKPGWKIPFRDGETMVGTGGFVLMSSRFLRAASALSKEGVTRDVADFYCCVERRKEMEAAGVQYGLLELAFQFSKDEDDRRAFSECFGFHDESNLEGAKCWLEKCWLK